MLSLTRHFIRIASARRLTAFLVMAAVNVFFIIWTALVPWNLPLYIVAVSLSGCALCALFIFNILGDASIDRYLFKAPQGYAVNLMPVKSWKLLLSRTIAIVAQDVIGLGLGVAASTYLSLRLGGVGERVYRYFDFESILSGALIFVIMYTMIALAVAFARIMSSTVFYRTKGRGILSLLATLAALYALSFLNFLAAPFGYVQYYGSMFLIDVGSGLSAGGVVYLLALIAQCAALFIVTSRLMERKINL